MSLDTTIAVDDIRRIARETDAEAVALAAYDQLLRALEQLQPDDWSAPTECTGWDVAAMVGHLIGAAKAGASLRHMLRQQMWGARNARRYDGNSLDAANDLQVRDHSALSPDERIASLRELAPAAVRGRLRTPRPMRRIQLPLDAGGSTAVGSPERLAVGDLMDVIYTRDVWLHTVDITRATGRPRPIDEQLDRRIVEDVVAEWAARHEQPVVLTLTGPVTGRYRQGDGGARLTVDAIDLCRILSGRAEPHDLAISEAAPTGHDLLLTRVVF